MIHRTIITLTIGLAVLQFGCVYREQPPGFGDSVHMTMAQQTLNPGPASLEPVTGLDGAWAAKSMENLQNQPPEYRESKSVDLGSLFKVGEKE